MSTDKPKQFLDSDFFTIAQTLQDLYIQKHIYGANIIEELHANENAHSRLLRMLLQYRKDGKYPLFDDFVRTFVNPGLVFNKPIFSNEEERIDLLIHDRSSAIIIENKVMDAVDQDRQIERYLIKANEKFGIQDENIYVVYLTGDGTKKASDYSLTSKAKEKLGVTNYSTGRFIECNFMYDILEWMRSIRNNGCFIEEPLLSSAIIQYTDYLEKLFYSTNSMEQELDKELNKEMENTLGLNSIEDYINAETSLADLQSRIFTQKVALQKTLLEGLIRRCRGMVESLSPGLDFMGEFAWNFDHSYDGNYFEITLGKFADESWMTCQLDRGHIYFGITKSKAPSESIKNRIERMRDSHSLQYNDYWYCWKWTRYYTNSEFWINVDSDEVAEYFIREAVSVLKDIYPSK